MTFIWILSGVLIGQASILFIQGCRGKKEEPRPRFYRPDSDCPVCHGTGSEKGMYVCEACNGC